MWAALAPQSLRQPDPATRAAHVVRPSARVPTAPHICQLTTTLLCVLGFARYLRCRLLVHQKGRGDREGHPHAAAHARPRHRPRVAAQPVQSIAEVYQRKCAGMPLSRWLGSSAPHRPPRRSRGPCDGAPLILIPLHTTPYPGTQSLGSSAASGRAPACAPRPSAPFSVDMSSSLTQQDSNGRPHIGPHLLCQLCHGRLAMGNPRLERAAARRRGGWRLERTCVVCLVRGLLRERRVSAQVRPLNNTPAQSKFGVR